MQNKDFVEEKRKSFYFLFLFIYLFYLYINIVIIFAFLLFIESIHALYYSKLCHTASCKGTVNKKLKKRGINVAAVTFFFSKCRLGGIRSTSDD